MSLYWPQLFEVGGGGGMGGINIRPDMFHWLVGDGELTQVVAEHLWFDLHLAEGFSILHAHHAAHHLPQDGHVPLVGLPHL